MAMGPMLTSVRFPTAETDLAGSIPPGEILFNGFLLLLVCAEVRVVQGELSQGGEVTFDAVQPRSVAGCKVESDAVLGRPIPDLGLEVIAGVIQHDVQRPAASVAAAKPTHKPEELDPVLPRAEGAEQSIGLHVVGAPHVPHAPPNGGK